MLGSKIRETRQQKGLTLNELAEKTELTASYLSQVERGIVDPSLSSLRKISMALGVPIYAFLETEIKQPILIPASKRKKLDLPDSKIVYEFITPMASDKTSPPKMEMIYFQLEPKSWSSDDNMAHAADECIFVVEGRLEVFVDKTRYVLEEGDSIYIHENIPHRIYNPGSKKTIGISNICPPIY